MEKRDKNAQEVRDKKVHDKRARQTCVTNVLDAKKKRATKYVKYNDARLTYTQAPEEQGAEAAVTVVRDGLKTLAKAGATCF